MHLSLPRIVRDLTGNENRRYADVLMGLLDATIAGARLAHSTVAGDIGRVDAVEKMRDIEHDGDAWRNQLESELRTSLVTPLDREDLFRLGRLLDDVLDNLRDFLREYDYFEMTSSPIIEPVTDTIVQSLAELRTAVEVLATSPALIKPRALAAKKAGSHIRRIYDLQLATLYRGELSMDTLRQRDLLRRLDIVGLRYGEAIDALADAAVKRSEA